MKLRAGDAYLNLDRTAIMGVLNVTPDSFSDGGLWLDRRAAVEHGLAMVSQGATLIDVGGESTRPGAAPVDEDEELRRVMPVVEDLASATDALISIDTRKVAVARRALEAGASIVNDTLGEAADHAMDELAAHSGAAIVVMHSRGTPETMRALTDYDDVVADVTSWLERRTARLLERGVAREAIVVDPGYGFAKTPEQNLELLRGLDAVLALGFPVLVGTSRKSFLGALLDAEVDDRVEGTAATVAWAVARGAHIVRVHDVAPIARTVKTIEAILSSGRA